MTPMGSVNPNMIYRKNGIKPDIQQKRAYRKSNISIAHEDRQSLTMSEGTRYIIHNPDDIRKAANESDTMKQLYTEFLDDIY